MRVRLGLLLVLAVSACGCSHAKSTDQLLDDAKSSDDRARLVAVRLLAQRKHDAAQVVPVLMEALKDKDTDVRISAAIGLGYFGEGAVDAVPALQTAQRDADTRVREAAEVALSRIRRTGEGGR